MNLDSKYLLRKLSTDGYLEFKNIIPKDMLSDLNSLIDESKTKSHGFQNFVGESVLPIVSFIRLLKEFNIIEAFSRQVIREMNSNILSPNVEDKSFLVLRCVDESSDSVSHKRHYDSHLLTILISIKTSNQSDMNGDLVVYPNNRIIKSVIFNVFEKLITKLDQALPLLVRKKITAHDLRVKRGKRIRTEAGAVYVFNGHVTMHCNLNVEKGERRTLLIHDYDPGLALGISNGLRYIRRAKSLWSKKISSGN